jgi:hypothetical protein
MELQADERITTPNMKLRDIGKSTLMRLILKMSAI